MHNEFNQKELFFLSHFLKRDTGSPTGQFFIYFLSIIYSVYHTRLYLMLRRSVSDFFLFIFIIEHKIRSRFFTVLRTFQKQGERKRFSSMAEIKIGRDWTHFFLAHILINCVKMSRSLMNGFVFEKHFFVL